MSRFIAILLLIVVAWQSGGYYLLFEISRYTARSAALERVAEHKYDEKEVVVIDLPIHAIAQLRHFYKNEYVIDGKLYDLVRADTIASQTLRLYCLYDAQEQAIYATLYSYFKPIHSPIGAKKAQQLLQYLSLKYLVPRLIDRLSPAISVLSSVFNAMPLPVFIGIVLAVISPPPKN